MKIICTQAEKDTIIDMVLASGDICLMENDPPVRCFKNCIFCAEANIDWVITDKGRNWRHDWDDTRLKMMGGTA